MPNNPNAVNQVQNEMLQEQAVRTMVAAYALNRTGRKQGNVTPQQSSQYAQELLNDVIPKWAANNFGNRDGKFDSGKINELKKHPTTRIIGSMVQKFAKADTAERKVAENISRQKDQARLQELDDELKTA